MKKLMSYGLDIIETENTTVKKCDLFVETIPFESDYFEYVTACDFIEHVPRVIYYKDKLFHPFIHVMNETYRVLKKDGKFFIKSPLFSSYNDFFWTDPTHVNPLSLDIFLMHFCTVEEKIPKTPWAANYGFNGNFEVINVQFIESENFHGDESKPKLCDFTVTLKKI
jgi:ubiquinone/menaquinone biosynthesis C-methylase UbiE